MRENDWADVRAQHETAALVSGVSAFAWQSDGDTGSLIVDFIAEAEDDDEADDRVRVEPVDEEEADRLVDAVDDPFRFRSLTTKLLTQRSVTPLHEKK